MSRSRGAAAPALSPSAPDYDADDILVVSDSEQLRALGADVRSRIVILLRDRARSTTELAEELGVPKGTAAHHVKVLERASLIRVVRTRRVRAVTERYYGRVARLFVVQSEDDELTRSFVVSGLRAAANEFRASEPPDERATFAFPHARLSELDARRLRLRLERLVEEFRARETPEGEPYSLVAAIYPTEPRG